MNNGKLTLFWEDPWLYNKPLCVVAPILYDLCHDKLASVYHVLTVDGRLNFRRWLPPILFENWINILGDVYKFSFDNIDDVVTWKWSKYGFFSTKSMYNHLTSDESGPKFSHIWKAKIPYKIKIFCWLAEKNAILTKENLVKRNWVGNPTCCFCEDLESTAHLFFLCPVARVIWGIVGRCLGATNIPGDFVQYHSWIQKWLPGGSSTYMLCLAAICWAIWKRRNKACFDNKHLKHPAEIIIHACSFISY